MRTRTISVGFALCAIGMLSTFGVLPIPQAYAQQFSVSIKTSKSTVEPRQTFVYSITVRNTGSKTVEDTDIFLSIDKNLDAQSASNNGKVGSDKVQWNDVTISSGQSRTFTASVRVDDNAEDGDRLYATAVAGNGFAEKVIRVEDEEDANNDDERAITVRLYSSKGQVEPGETLSFIVETENHNNKRASNVDVTVELANNLTFLSASNQGKGSGNKITWKGIDIDGNEKRTFTASVRVEHDTTQGDSLISTAYSEGSVNEHKINVWDPDFGREQMRLNMFTDITEVEAGGNLTYTLRVRNLADNDERTNILAYIDPRTTVSSISGDGQQFEQNMIVWEREPFSQSETKSFTLSVKVPETIPAGDVLRFSTQAGLDRRELVIPIIPSQSGTFVSSLFGSPAEPILVASNNVQTAQVQMQAAPVANIITITQSTDKTEVQPGSSLTFSLALTNNSNQPLQNIHVQESFPNGTLEVQDTGNGTHVGSSMQWMITSLQPSETWNTTYRVLTTSSLSHGTVVTSSATAQDSSNQVLAHSERHTNIISTLPQAGWGAFVVEVASAKDHIRVVQSPLQKQMAQISQPQSEKFSSMWSRILWIGIILGGILLGVLISIVIAQNTILPEPKNVSLEF